MASKPKKSTKGVVNVKPKKQTSQGFDSGTALSMAMHALLGGLAFYFLHPILALKPAYQASSVYLFSLLCAVLAGFGASGFFKKFTPQIAVALVPLIIVQVLINVMLTYGWMESSSILQFIANTMTIPLGIVLYFILKYQSTATASVDLFRGYPIKEVFAERLPKIAALLIVIVAGFLIFYRLGYFDIWEDENLVINAAVGVYEQGFSYLKDGYDRAWSHTIMCTGIFEVFGVSEFTGRLPSAIFGLAFVIICFYVFARWYGLVWLALLIPLICLMNDRFLILFRYMRMYAVLIPVFLLCVYLIMLAIDRIQQPLVDDGTERKTNQWLYPALALLSLPLLAHLHKLAMIVLPVFGLYIVYLVLQKPTKSKLRVLWAVLAGTLVMLVLTFVVQLDSFRMFRQVATRIFSPHTPMTAYFEYMFQNGLPVNSTLLFLLGGLGLLSSKISNAFKSLLVVNYLFITIATVAMVYLIGAEGRDYRYIAHIVPFVVCTVLVSVYAYSKLVWRQSYPWTLIALFFIAALQLGNNYDRVYVRHPWSPRYSVVYKTLEDQYKPGDALFATNIKTYYLDAVALAGEHYHKVPKKKSYTLDQLKTDTQIEGHGWFLWERHKTHQLREDVVQYIYKNFKPVHNSRMDDLGVELFYFDESMIR